MNAVENINYLEIPECTLFNSYTFSNYITLVDKKGVPVVFDFNGESCFFTFKKCHLSLNLDNHKNDFKFFEKLYIAGLLQSDYQWKNLLMIKFNKTIQKFKPIEPRQLSLEIHNGSPKFFITTKNKVMPLNINMSTI